ncbi:Abi family protein [Legionella septentrionalis]|uniref:Abi family protein n=1 Tax=Legionella septentrionalis TaxID=2498109 RepID=UPI0013154CC5|nr:Abi family protein [Legionella septentrionalis]
MTGTIIRGDYSLPLPIWVAIELWDFGLLSVFYKGMTIQDKTILAAKYNLPDCQIMESWLRTLNYVRNVVAHHSRLWNRNLVDQPKLPKLGQVPEFDNFINAPLTSSRVYIVLCILAFFMRIICPRSTWPARIVELINSFPSSTHVSILDMGFSQNWQLDPFWELSLKSHH